jgi:hypothetical protein
MFLPDFASSFCCLAQFHPSIPLYYKQLRANRSVEEALAEAIQMLGILYADRGRLEEAEAMYRALINCIVLYCIVLNT